ncbi:ferrous iron transport protein A [candidate division TA06 bacterium B3_TA06]|uniref:Ferrous iron transport protein A n=1 Tax=candidate division TA06 bacterium B3_TA06 TaxID=2012487 RepID=A0A532V9P8_UNCT6|nr:MAG: ferrous iron transport protein A [candidate division TA06 bacterium B3_TA06]
MSEKLLTDLSINEEAEIVEIRGGRGMQARLRALGLSEGQHVKKLSHVGLGGPVVILVNRAQVAIGRGMARRIIVRSNDG